jgi:uncharacterized membrane protein YgdD (TMEM256/DUF423 family)
MGHKKFLIAGAVLGMTGVMIGAFGAHGLKTLLEATQRVEVFDTGVRYQMYHALALLGLGILYERRPSPLLKAAGWAFIFGTLIFSLSIYALCLLDQPKLGMITPIGGVGLIAGWALLLIQIIKQK